MNVVRRFGALPGDRKRLYLEAWRAVWASRVRLGTARRSRVQDVVGPVPASDTSQVAGPRAVEAAAVPNIARAVETVSTFVPGATCLVKAIALRVMLDRRGRLADIRFGVARQGASIGAHAWVEVPGVGEFGREGEHLEFVPLVAPAPCAVPGATVLEAR